NCFACHDSKKRKGKLDMTTYESFRKGGSKDDPVEPGKPGESLILEMVTSKGAGRMPPKEAGDPLPKDKIAVIERWIKEGARLDAGIAAKADLMRELRVRWQPPTPPVAYKYPININALAFTPDNKKLAAGGCDRLVRVWDLAGGVANARLEQAIENHADWVFGVAFAPDGKHLLTGSRDKTAKVWDLVAKESVLTFPDHQNGVYGVAVKPDGKIGVSVGADNQVRYWNATGDGKQV